MPNPRQVLVAQHLRSSAFALGIDYPFAERNEYGHLLKIGVTQARSMLAATMYDTPMEGGLRCSWPEVASAIGYASHSGAMAAARIGRKEIRKIKRKGKK